MGGPSVPAFRVVEQAGWYSGGGTRFPRCSGEAPCDGRTKLPQELARGVLGFGIVSNPGESVSLRRELIAAGADVRENRRVSGSHVVILPHVRRSQSADLKVFLSSLWTTRLR